MVGGPVDRLFVDLGGDGRVQVSSWVEGEFPDSVGGEPPALVWPLDADVLEDLRWYLEDYLRAPFGVYGHRGVAVANTPVLCADGRRPARDPGRTGVANEAAPAVGWDLPCSAVDKGGRGR